MRFLGGLLVAIGLLSAGLHFLDMNFIFLQWINQWGERTGWLIRGGIMLLGVVLYFIGKPSDQE